MDPNEEPITVPKDEFDAKMFKTLVSSVQELRQLVIDQKNEIDRLTRSNARLRADVNRIVRYVRSNG